MFASDDVRVSLSGSAPNYLIHQFKKVNDNNSDLLRIKVEVQVTLPPETSSVLLQIYNNRTGAWETLFTEGTADAEEDFDLYARIRQNLSDYYDIDNEVAVRVYQQVTAGSKLLDVDLVEILFIRAYDDLYTAQDTSYVSKYRPSS